MLQIPRIIFYLMCLRVSTLTAFSLQSNIHYPIKAFQPRLDTKLKAASALLAVDKQQGLYTLTSQLSAAIVAIELLSLRNPAAAPLLGTIFPAYTAAALSALVLSDAAGRNRLSSQTFKILNLGLLLGALQTLSSTLPILSAISRSKNNLKTVFGLLCLTHAWLTTRITYYSLSTFGLPTTQFNVKLNAPLSLSYQFLAVSNFFLPPQLISCSLLITGIFTALSGAATVGQSRLASNTYKTLNSAVIIISLGKLYGLLPFWPKHYTPALIVRNLFLFFYPVFTLLTALYGFCLGSAYTDSKTNISL